jgi:hypothetical protein
MIKLHTVSDVRNTTGVRLSPFPAEPFGAATGATIDIYALICKYLLAFGRKNSVLHARSTYFSRTCGRMVWRKND